MRGTKALWFALAVTLAAPAVAAVPGRITVAASSISGDWGTGVDTDRQAALVSFVWGRETRLHAELEFLDVRSDGTVVVQTPFGPVSAGQRAGTGAGPGPGGDTGQGAGGSGAGSGPGGPGGVPPSAEEPETLVLGEQRARGLGDLRLGVEQTLLGGGSRRFRLEAELGVKVPTADEEEYLGTGEWDARVGLVGEYELWTGRLFAGAGWNRLGDPSWTVLEDVFDVHAGLASDPLAGGLMVAGWLEANEEVLAGAGDRAAVGLSVRGGGRVRWRIGLTAGLGGSAEDLSVAFGVSLGTTGGGTGRQGRSD